MKTIIENATNCSRYLFAEDKQITITSECIEVRNPNDLIFSIFDLNSGNATLIEGVSTPDDWYGGKYTCSADGTWTAVADWVDPREES